MIKFNIRKAVITDVDEVSRLFDKYRSFYGKPEDYWGAVQFINQRLIHNDSEIYLATLEDQDEAIGFTQLYPLFSSTRMKRLWLLNDLYVEKEYRNLGISKALINKAKDLAKNTDACGVMLETGKTNDVGNHLYPLVGFEVEETSNFYFWTNS